MPRLSAQFTPYGELSATSIFIDRQSESGALTEALEFHARDCADGASDTSFRNIMSFYGGTGHGKTYLSRRLEWWLNGDLSRNDDWGMPPATSSRSTARWELNDFNGNVDPIRLMLAVRRGLHKHKASWPAFDLAFAAYFSSVRPTGVHPTADDSSDDFAQGLGDILADLAETLGAPPIIGGFTGPAVRKLIRFIRDGVDVWHGKQTNPNILNLLERCLTEPSEEKLLPLLAAEVLWQLSLEIDAMPAEERPQLVVFVDHFEKVQDSVHGIGESIVNSFVTALPYALFVITGQNMLDWHLSERHDLRRSGPVAWPGLQPGVTEGPRQHILRYLSAADTRALLIRRRDAEGLKVSDATIEKLVESTEGWPVHIDAVASLARNLQHDNPQREITDHDLVGSLQVIVKRLLASLPDDEKRVFQAACILPFFDQQLVAAVAGDVDTGAIVRCLTRATVMENPGSTYPYRVHEAVREAVRNAGPLVSGGWADADWYAAAQRGLKNAEQRIHLGMAAQNDPYILESIALAISLFAVHEGDPEWLDEQLKHAPTLIGLRRLIPASDKLVPGSEARGFVEFIELLDEKATDESVRRLDALGKSNLGVASRAALWRAYRLRNVLGRYDEAIAQLTELDESPGNTSGTFRRQIAVTLIAARRFSEAADVIARLEPQAAADTQDLLDRVHGHLETGVSVLRDRVARATARRFQMELAGTLTLTRARLGQIDRAELVGQLETATSVGHRAYERDILTGLGYLSLTNDHDFDIIVGRVRLIERALGYAPRTAELLALKSMATGDSSLLAEAVELAREQTSRADGWVPSEFALRLAGAEIDWYAPTWLEPEHVVRERWEGIMLAIVDRAR